MLRFENRVICCEDVTGQLDPPEKLNALHSAQNKSFEDLEFVNCEVLGGSLVTFGAPINRATVKRIRGRNCKLRGFFAMGAILDDVAFDGLAVSGRHPVILDACAFRHVILKGKCGRILINRDRCHDDPDRNAAFHAANGAFYDSVDWALDISELRTTGLELRGAIPARLIRRNVEEHIALGRQVAESGE